MNEQSNINAWISDTVSPDKNEIPLEGSLGLLALGYKGLMLWREKRVYHGKNKS